MYRLNRIAMWTYRRCRKDWKGSIEVVIKYSVWQGKFCPHPKRAPVKVLKWMRQTARQWKETKLKRNTDRERIVTWIRHSVDTSLGGTFMGTLKRTVIWYYGNKYVRLNASLLNLCSVTLGGHIKHFTVGRGKTKSYFVTHTHTHLSHWWSQVWKLW